MISLTDRDLTHRLPDAVSHRFNFVAKSFRVLIPRFIFFLVLFGLLELLLVVGLTMMSMMVATIILKDGLEGGTVTISFETAIPETKLS